MAEKIVGELLRIFASFVEKIRQGWYSEEERKKIKKEGGRYKENVVFLCQTR